MDLMNQISTCKDCAKYNDKRGYTGRGMCERYLMLVSPDAEICGRFTPKGRRKLSKAERRAIWEDAGGKCQYCGCEVRLASMEVDHVVPYICGGKDERSNMVCACHACNHYKNAYGVNGMRDQIERLPDKLMDDTTFKLAVRYGLVTITKKPVVFEFERRHGRVRECNECAHFEELHRACKLTQMHCNHGDICKEFRELNMAYEVTQGEREGVWVVVNHDGDVIFECSSEYEALMRADEMNDLVLANKEPNHDRA